MWPRGRRGAGNSRSAGGGGRPVGSYGGVWADRRRGRTARGGSAGMWASTSVSSGAMGTNCDDVQQAVQVPHGTTDSPAPRMAARISASHDEKSPAGSAPSAPASPAGNAPSAAEAEAAPFGAL